MGGKASKPDDIPGVIYSENWQPPDADAYATWRGAMYHVRPETMPKPMVHFLDVDAEVRKEGPETAPYTFWERIGAVPVSAARLRPRQYYYPTTDFSKFTYDDQSPEEVLLRAKWIARMYEFGWTYPATVFTASSAMCVPLPFRIRLPAMVACAITAVALEMQRVYALAAKEKEHLDDFLFAKEVWYIKNVEARELGVELLPVGVTAMDGLQSRMEEERAEDLVQASMIRDGMLATYRSPPPPGLDSLSRPPPHMMPPQQGKAGAGGGPDGTSFSPDQGFYAGIPGQKRPGQIVTPRPSLLGMNQTNRMPDLPA